MSEAWICRTCGTQFQPSDKAPSVCPICEDDRQFVGHEGQQWTTQKEQNGFRSNVAEEEPGVWSLQTVPKFAIGQKAYIIETPDGNILWDCISFLDKTAKDKIRQLGGLSAIAISHPHYYTTMVDWAQEFKCPVYLPEADVPWVMRNDRRICFWSGSKMELVPGVTLLRLGGHFPGSTVLHWAGTGDKGSGGIMLTGDTIQIVQDCRWVSFMYSYPNLIPLPAVEVGRIRDAIKPWEYDRLYGAFTRIDADAAGTVQRSADRYIGILNGTFRRNYF